LHPIFATAILAAVSQSPSPTSRPRRVAFFVTCLVDLFRPSIGFAAVKLLEEAGCTVEVPPLQVCCGQPAYNSGDRATTRAIAAQVIEAFEGYDAVVAPSGSCGGMLSHHYPGLFDDDPAMKARAENLAARSYELMAFLVDVLGVKKASARYDGTVTYHDSCSGLRELGVKAQPRWLLATVEGLSVREMKTPEVCCGFGGTFCVKYPEISNAMVGEKSADIAASGADTLLAGDLGCLMNMAGKLQREGSTVRVRHVAEVLAGMGDLPPIGEPG
jgi:L-lactate dehydrogenase complex protein LldE